MTTPTSPTGSASVGSRHGLECAAQAVLKRAVELDSGRRYLESLTCYREGIALLMDVMQAMPRAESEKRDAYRARVDEYMKRAEKIKALVDERKNTGKFHEQIRIAEGSTGFDYGCLLKPIVCNELQKVTVQDAYVRHNHQLLNLVRLCEYFVHNAKSIREIQLITTKADQAEIHNLQKRAFCELKDSLMTHKVQFSWTYSQTLHDREIRFDTGWVVKIGRGLDYFKKPASNYAIGAQDMNLRPCMETTVDIYYAGH